MAHQLLGRLPSGQELVRIVCALEPCAADKGERWIHIVPHGPKVEARDGRRFTLTHLERIVEDTEMPLLVDWEHASEAGDTRAAGWIEQLKVEPLSEGERAGIWGRVDWTPQGGEHVTTRHYRFLSPVLIGRREHSVDAPLGEFSVERIASVALTNRPALRMQGIESFRAQLSERFGPFAETSAMDEKTRAALCTAFGLAADATDQAIIAAATPIIESAKSQSTESIAQREAAARLTSELSKAREKLAELDTELSTTRAQAFAAEVKTFFDEGSRAGKIPPAARSKWLEHCSKSRENFETFKTIVYPDLVPLTERAQTSAAPRRVAQKRSANGVDLEALRSLGFTDEQIKESETEVFSRKRHRDEDDDGDDEDDGDGGDPDASTAGEQPAQTGG